MSEILPAVYVRIERPKDYEDVCPELVIEDAIQNTAFEIADATEEIAALRTENERLRSLASFGALLLPKWWDDGNPGDIDGGDAQEAAEACGLWHEVERHADGVECEWCGNEGPCGELTEAGLAVIAAPEVSR